MTTNEIEETIKEIYKIFGYSPRTTVSCRREGPHPCLGSHSEPYLNEEERARLKEEDNALRQSLLAYGEKCKEEERERIKDIDLNEDGRHMRIGELFGDLIDRV